MLGFEIVLHSYRFWKGDITSWKEYGYHLARGVAASAGMGIGNWVGCTTGMVIGTVLGGPVGAIVGAIVGGIVGGIIGAACARKAFEQAWSDDFIYDEQKQRSELITKALALFDILDPNDKDKFNKKRL